MLGNENSQSGAVTLVEILITWIVSYMGIIAILLMVY